MTAVTEEEKLALRFYLGDPQTAADGPYRGGPQAYNTINALLHPGFANEQDKAREGRTVHLEDAQQLDSYLRLCTFIFSAMNKFRHQHAGEAPTGWRVDRLSSLQRFLQDGRRIAGFFSCSSRGWMSSYAHVKKQAVLLEAVPDAAAPYVDIAALLKDFYAKPEEAEILFPAGTAIAAVQELPLTAQEKALYTDMDGQPPVGRYRLQLTAGEYPAVPDAELAEIHGRILSAQPQASAVMDAVMNGRMPDRRQAAFYEEWKADIRRYIGGVYHKILKQEI